MAAATLASAPLPPDVRLMNGVSNTVFTLATITLLAALAAWVARLPWFNLQGVRIDGEITHSSEATIRANAAPHLQGNFFTINLAQGQAAFERVPWVRSAVLRRIWPDHLGVTLEEHRAAALWVGEKAEDRMVNSYGEVFQANVGDVEDEGLPTFDGPPGSAPSMLKLYQRLGPLFAPVGARIDTLRLSGRGAWRLQLDSGAQIEIGSGSDDEVVQRCERFVRTLAQVTDHFQRTLESADLRHTEGYAVRLQGITTTVAPLPPVRKK
jgi:cell division protein FtsQ